MRLAFLLAIEQFVKVRVDWLFVWAKLEEQLLCNGETYIEAFL